MATKQQILDFAASLCGSDRIVDPAGDGNAKTRRIVGLYPFVYEQCLSVWPWACARSRRLLNVMEPTPEWGFSYQYALPGETLTIAAAQTGTPWEVEKRHLLTNCPGPTLRVISIDTVTEEHLHPKVSEYVSFKLAYAASMGVSDSTSLQERLERKTREAFMEAAHAENAQGSSLDMLGSGWVLAMQTAYAPELRVAAATDVSGVLSNWLDME